MTHLDFSRRPVNRKRERLMGIWIPGLLLILITLANLIFFGWYRVRNRDIHSRIAAMETSMEESRSGASRYASALSQNDSKVFMKEYRFLRRLTHQKSLQWSALFSRLEETLPPSVRISVVSLTVKRSRLALAISAEAMTKADQLLFLEAIQAHSWFRDPFVEFEQLDPATRNLKFSMTVEYRGQHGQDH